MNAYCIQNSNTKKKHFCALIVSGLGTQKMVIKNPRSANAHYISLWNAKSEMLMNYRFCMIHKKLHEKINLKIKNRKQKTNNLPL